MYAQTTEDIRLEAAPFADRPPRHTARPFPDRWIELGSVRRTQGGSERQNYKPRSGPKRTRDPYLGL